MKERRVRLFISSTFRDMNAERDYLNTYVFPQVKDYCRRRYIDFIPVDLRWGITEEESKNIWFQIETKNKNIETRGGKYNQPYAFTEQGVAMLATILRTKINDNEICKVLIDKINKLI